MTTAQCTLARVLDIKQCPPFDVAHEISDYPEFYDPLYYPHFYVDVDVGAVLQARESDNRDRGCSQTSSTLHSKSPAALRSEQLEASEDDRSRRDADSSCRPQAMGSGRKRPWVSVASESSESNAQSASKRRCSPYMDRDRGGCGERRSNKE
ncbi:hypothetical protein CC2G_011443 [Coprinopsis cinerea AmutBmut pab1-1]|nr:hypothetical protein CC2G_011443 [Coprinopsis cinerea AmutBmut pab1-1]